MISNAETIDINELKTLWQICFGDEKEYIDFFFSDRFVPENTFVYIHNNRVVAQLFLLEGVFRVSEKEYPSYYLYAACTHPDFRRKGIMKELLLSVEQEAKNRNIGFICLVPAEKSLFDYYSKFSYKPVFSKKVFSVEKSDLSVNDNDIVGLTLNNEDISAFRNKYLTARDCLLWDNKAIDYAVKENRFSDGDLIVTDYGYALLRPVDEDVCRVIEICCAGNRYAGIIEQIFNIYHFQKILIDAPVDLQLKSKCIVSQNAMALAVSDEAKELIDSIGGACFGLPLE